MITKPHLLVSFILMAFLFSSCSVLQGPCTLPEEMPPIISVPPSELNRDIVLIADEGWNDFKIDSAIRILVQVPPDYGFDVMFAPDFGARMFTFCDGEWRELNNLTIYLNTDDFVISPGLDWLSGELLVVRPVLDDESQSVQLRIFVFGHRVMNGVATDDLVGGYVDVTLRP